MDSSTLNSKQSTMETQTMTSTQPKKILKKRMKKVLKVAEPSSPEPSPSVPQEPSPSVPQESSADVKWKFPLVETMLVGDYDNKKTYRWGRYLYESLNWCR